MSMGQMFGGSMPANILNPKLSLMLCHQSMNECGWIQLLVKQVWASLSQCMNGCEWVNMTYAILLYGSACTTVCVRSVTLGQSDVDHVLHICRPQITTEPQQ